MPITLDRPDNTKTGDITAKIQLNARPTIHIHGRVTGNQHAPAVLVLGGISSDRRVTANGAEAGWWSHQIGTGCVLDPARAHILSADFLADEAGPCPSTTDQARAMLAFADAAGIDRFSVIGASYGGMIALALAVEAPARIEKLLVISAAHRPSAMAQAWRSIQRDTVELALRHGDGKTGLDLARRLAMTSYRTPIELESRFYNPEPGGRDCGGISHYLSARGQDFADRITPQRFLALSRSMDTHRINPAQIRCPVHYVAVIEDQLVPPEHIAEAARATPRSTLTRIHSLYGHDAFLKEDAAVADNFAAFLGA